MNIQKKYIKLGVIAGLLISALVVAIVVKDYYSSSQTLVVQFENVEKVTVFDASNAIDEGKKKVKEVTNSGESVRLKNGYDYNFEYTSKSGYESGQISLKTPEDNHAISIKPYYSKNRLDAQLSNESALIKQAFEGEDADIVQYEIQRGKLYHFGEWYGTTLKYKGSDVYNSDTLRVLLKKEGGKWVLKSDPPSLYLSKFDYPDVPLDILRDINSLE